ncbi:metal ABC transporter substrate-binding protein [soil metagenome]
MRRRFALALSTLLVAVLGACGGDSDGTDDSRRSIVTAFYPLTFVATAVAGDEADVSSITPAGVEPHDLELTAAQVRRVSEADLLIYIGQGFQPALDRLVPEVANTLDVLTVRPPGVRADDPHIWLDPSLMVGMTDTVVSAMSKVDPNNAPAYRENGDELIAQIHELDDNFSNGLSLCERRTIVTTHESFGYLADRFNLEQVGIAGIDPDQEPSARRLNEVAEIVENQDITTIFFETLLPEDLADTIAAETGADTAVLDPLESPPATGNYISAMRANLSALRTALGCR